MTTAPLHDTRSCDTAVTPVHSARTPDAASTRMLLDVYLPELSRLRHVDPLLVENELARYGLFTRAGALDFRISEDEELDPFDLFISEIIEHTDRDLDLTRWSLTAPEGRDDRVAILAAGRELLARINAYGDHAGAWIARDRRDVDGDAGHHWYGVTAAKREERSSILDAWISITKAKKRTIDIRTVGRWSHYATTGDDRRLRHHLTKCIEYELKDLPRGEVRDLDTDVLVSGGLDAPWSAFRKAGGPSAHRRPASPTSRRTPIRGSVDL